MRRPARRSPRSATTSVGDRLWHASGCALIGALWGAVPVGIALYLGHPASAWFVFGAAVASGVLALFLGPAIADLLVAPLHFVFGVVLGWSDAWELMPSHDDSQLPAWLKWVFWAGLITGVLLWFVVF